MVGTVDICLNAANPNFPIKPVYSFVGSPSNYRILNVPKKIGNWEVTSVSVSCAYADNSIESVSAVRVGGVWVASVSGCETSGKTANGFTVFASGTDENGNLREGYVLGRGDLVVLNGDSTITVGERTYYVHLVDELPSNPHKGDLVFNDGWKIFDGEEWKPLSSPQDVSWDDVTDKPSVFPSNIANVDGLSSALATKVTNHGGDNEIRFTNNPDTGNVVFHLRDGFVDRVLLASVGDGESIEFNWIEDGATKALHTDDIATKDALEGKADLSQIPTSTSQLTNDSGFITNFDYPIAAIVGNTCKDQTINTITPASNVTINAPAAKSSGARDWLVVVNQGATARTVTFVGTFVAQSGFSWPTMEANKSYIFSFTEISSNKYLVNAKELANV